MSLLASNLADINKIQEAFEGSLGEDIEPLTDIRASAEYRMQIAKVIGYRTIAKAIERANVSKGNGSPKLFEEAVIIVNGQKYELEIHPWESLNYVIRERLGLIGTKRGCETGGCGSCTVLLSGKAVYSCMTYALQAAGKELTTIEGLERDRSGLIGSEKFHRGRGPSNTVIARPAS